MSAERLPAATPAHFRQGVRRPSRPDGDQSIEWRARVEQARIEMRRGNPPGAVQALNELAQASPTSAEEEWLHAVAMSLLGRALVDSGEVTEGRQILEGAARLQPERLGSTGAVDPEDAADLAAALRYLDRVDDAVRVLEAATAEASIVPWRVRLEFGRALRLADRPDAAIEQLSAALAEKPDDPFVLRERAACYAQAGQTANAVRDLRDAAMAFTARDRLTDADEAAARAVELAPSEPEILAIRADILLRAQQPEQAESYVEAALAVAPDYLWAHYLHALALYNSERYEQAAAAAEKVLVQLPGQADTVQLAVAAMQSVGDAAGAELLLDRAVAAEPGDLRLRLYRADLRSAGGQDEAARAEYETVLAAEPSNLQALIGAGECARRLGDAAAATQLFERAVALVPDDLALRLSYAEMLRLTERYDDSLRQLETVLERDPRNAYALGTRGQIRLLRPDEAEAGLADLHNAVEIDGTLSWAAEELGEALLAAGRLDDAVALLDDRDSPEPAITVAVARQLMEHGRLEDAVRVLERARAARADQPGVTTELIYALHASNNYEQAAEVGRSAGAELAPRAAAYTADAMRMLGQTEDALAWANRSIEAERWPWALAVRGNVHRMLGDFESAERDLREALADDPEAEFARRSLGRVLRMRGDYAEAAELLRAAAADPDTLPVYKSEYADCLLMQGDAMAALEPAEAGVSGGRTTFSVGVLGCVLRVLGRFEDALSAVEEASVLAGGPVPSWVSLEHARVLLDMGRAADARAFAEQAVEASPEDAFARGVLGVVLSDLNATDALRELDASLRLSPSPWVAETRTSVLLALGRYRQIVDERMPDLDTDAFADDWTPVYFASACLRLDPPNPGLAIRASERKPRSPDPLLQALRLLVRGQAYRVLDGREVAGSYYEPAAAILTNLPEPGATELHLLGWVQTKLGQYRAATRSLTRALEKRSTPDAQFDLALCLLHAGHGDRALAEYERAVERTRAIPDAERRRALAAAAARDVADSISVDGTLAESSSTAAVQALLAEYVAAPNALAALSVEGVE